jgi:predicted amidohydrolase
LGPWYPEAARLTALKGTEVLFYPTAIGLASGKKSNMANQYGAWMNVMKGHAVANGVYVAYKPYRVRKILPIQMEFFGASFIAGPRRDFAQASHDKEEIFKLRLIRLTRKCAPKLRFRDSELMPLAILQRAIDCFYSTKKKLPVGFYEYQPQY